MKWEIDEINKEIIITIDVQSTNGDVRRVHPEPYITAVHIPIVTERPPGSKRFNMLDVIYGYTIYKCPGKPVYVAVQDK